MPQGTKIATCCYCGTRAALVLTGRAGHELACASCGAPLHDLKALKTQPAPVKPGKTRMKTSKPKKKKRKKSLSRKLMGEAFDLLDDIFD
ncbi:hypothetical protein AB0T83_02505 [Fluviibacterium sp. DFM31]|uniref:TFIIB-type domain-containing protein n=1 Tax=Meridianimarinicoccus marinus TaxID=3231483 RepID=A0ABV3L296_9RHOB